MREGEVPVNQNVEVTLATNNQSAHACIGYVDTYFLVLENESIILPEIQLLEETTVPVLG